MQSARHINEDGEAPLTVSVVIPVYNGRRYLRRAVLSALDQTCPATEVIVVDDGSTDDCKAVVADLLPSIRWIAHERNAGLSAARNTGIGAAKGELIAFLDSDDWWSPQRLAAQVNLYRVYPEAEVSFCDFTQVLQSGEAHGWQGGLLAECRARGLALHDRGAGVHELGRDALWALVRYTSFMHPSTVMCRRAVFARVGGFDETLRAVEDLDMWFRLAAHCRLALLGETLVTVENRPDSLGHSTAKMAAGMLEVYQKAFVMFPEMPAAARAAATGRCAQQHLTLAWLARQSGHRQESRRQAMAAMRYAPSLKALGLLGAGLLPSKPGSGQVPRHEAQRKERASSF